MKHALSKWTAIFIALAVATSVAVAQDEPADRAGCNEETQELAGEAVRATLGADLIRTERETSLAGYFVVSVPSEQREKLASDPDLGPFLSIGGRSPETLTLVFVPPAEGAGNTYAVYFVGEEPVGLVAVAPSVEGRISPHDLMQAYRAVSSPAAESREELFFQPVELQADDGTPVPALRILTAGTRR